MRNILQSMFLSNSSPDWGLAPDPADSNWQTRSWLCFLAQQQQEQQEQEQQASPKFSNFHSTEEGEIWYISLV